MEFGGESPAQRLSPKSCSLCPIGLVVLVLRVVVPVNSGDRLDPLRVLQVIEPVPKALAQDMEKVQAGARDYQEISFSRSALKRLYALTLTLTLLLPVPGWSAKYLAKSANSRSASLPHGAQCDMAMPSSSCAW